MNEVNYCLCCNKTQSSQLCEDCEDTQRGMEKGGNRGN